LIEPVPEEIDKMEKEDNKSVEKIIEEGEKEGLVVKQEKEMTWSEKRAEREKKEQAEKLASWAPKTRIGKLVKEGKETDLDKVLDKEKKVLEPEIFDYLVKNIESDLILIGQAKGKFGGGKRRAWRQTQRKTKEGNILSFSAMAVVGNKKGYVGVGTGRAKETLPAREKAVRKAKINIIRINRSCAHFDCSCDEDHTVPFSVEGKSGSVRVKLIPAPQGTGLVVGDELKKVLRLAGISDVYGVSSGHTRTTFNAVKACFDALRKTREFKK